MKFRIDRDTFADAVAWTARSLPNRPSVPVLAGLLIETSDNGLTLSGFDYETSTRATLPAEVADDGRALVSGRLLSEIVKSLPAKPIDVSLDGSRVQVLCGSARFSLQTMPVEEYPQLPEMPTATGTIKADEFATAVSQASAAAGRDEMLPLLTGVRLEMEGSTISLMATDRYRASLRARPGSPSAATSRLGPRPGPGARRDRSVTGRRRRRHHRGVLGRGRRRTHRVRGHRGQRLTAHHHPPARR